VATAFPLLAGDRLIAALGRRLGWLFSWPAHLLWAATFLWGISIYALHFRRLPRRGDAQTHRSAFSCSWCCPPAS